MASFQSADVVDFGRIADLFNELDIFIRELANGQMPGLEPISLRLPPAEPPIHAFYTTVSWLYVRTIENGPVHFRFLAERSNAFGIDSDRELYVFRDDVLAFRTVLQHNLNLVDPDDLAKLVRIETWMASVLGHRLTPDKRFWPRREEDWKKLTTTLWERAKRFAELNLAAAKRVMKDEFAEDTIQQWALLYTRSLPAHEFDRLVSEAAADLGLKHLAITRVRKVHLDEWNRRLRLLPDDSDARREARRLVENTLLVEAENYLPIMGEDVIESLGVKPGPEVGKVLRKARELYRKTPYSRDELLGQLKAILAHRA